MRISVRGGLPYVDAQVTFRGRQIAVDNGRYVHALGATSGVIEHVPGCEGLVLDLDALWEEVERLAPKEDVG